MLVHRNSAVHRYRTAGSAVAGLHRLDTCVPVMMRDLYRYYGDREVLARHHARARYVLVQEQCPN
jgi:hypothetical protein